VRATPGATVATPLAWREVADRSLRPSRFTIRTIVRRIERGKDPWEGLSRERRSLSRARNRLTALLEEEASG
jgi:bifunctional non-homologous end joining protein LigD